MNARRAYYDNWQKKFSETPAVFDKVRIGELGGGTFNPAPEGSADMVLTFRNVHNWMSNGSADEVFASFFRTLKPGGILGVEEHRAANDKPQDPKAQSGYVREDYTIELADQGRLQVRWQVGDSGESQGYEGLAARCLDTATDTGAGRSGS